MASEPTENESVYFLYNRHSKLDRKSNKKYGTLLIMPSVL